MAEAGDLILKIICFGSLIGGTALLWMYLIIDASNKK